MKQTTIYSISYFEFDEELNITGRLWNTEFYAKEEDCKKALKRSAKIMEGEYHEEGEHSWISYTNTKGIKCQEMMQEQTLITEY